MHYNLVLEKLTTKFFLKLVDILQTFVIKTLVLSNISSCNIHLFITIFFILTTFNFELFSLQLIRNVGSKKCVKFGKFWKKIKKTIAEPPFSKNFIPPYKISSKSVKNWRKKVWNSIFKNEIQWMTVSKLLQIFLRQFSSELNEISCAYIKCNKEGGLGEFF